MLLVHLSKALRMAQPARILMILPRLLSLSRIGDARPEPIVTVALKIMRQRNEQAVSTLGIGKTSDLIHLCCIL